MKYYKVKTRILFQNKDEDGKVIGFGAKMPTYMKQYPYYKLAYKADGTEAILQSEEEVKEAVELTLEDAQTLVDDWTESHEDFSEEELDEENKMTGEILTKKAVPIRVARYNTEGIKRRMNHLHEGVS